MLRDLTSSRWISDKTGSAVSHVQPGASVRLEVDGSVALDEVVRVLEEPEPTLRNALKRLGRHTRRPVTTLRWDPWGTTTRHGSVRTTPWIASQSPPPDSVTEVVAEFSGYRSPLLRIGGPVHWRVDEQSKYDATLGAPIVEAIDAGVSASYGRRATVRGTAYAAVDPEVSVRVLAPSDDLFTEYYMRLLRDVGVMYHVRSTLLINVFFDLLDTAYPFARELRVEQLTQPRLELDEGETAGFEIELAHVPRDGVPFLLAGFEGALRRASSVSRLLVLPAIR
jgi:hypothetical protein